MGKYAIILVSALIFAGGTFSYSVMSNHRIADQRTVETFSYNQANNIAQSSLMIAVRELKENPGSGFVPAADQVITYPSDNSFSQWEELNGAYRLGFHNQGDTLLRIASEGRFNDVVYTAHAGLVFSAGGGYFNWPTLNQAVHSDGSLALTGSSRIYGDVSTNSTIAGDVSFGWSTNIHGNLAVGPGGDPQVVAPSGRNRNNPHNVTGSMSTLPSELVFDMPDFPDMPPSTPTGQSMRVTTWHEDQAQNSFHHTEFDGMLVEELAIQGNRTMTIDVGSQDRVLHVRNINIGQGNLHIVGDGKLTIYVEDSFSLGGGSHFNYSGEPENLMIYYGGNSPINFGGNVRLNSNIFVDKADIEISNSNQIRGNIISGGDNIRISGDAGSYSRVFYAPNADVTLSNSGRVYGSVVAKNFEASGDTYVEFQHGTDVEMPDIESGEGSGTPTYAIAYWN